MTVDSKSIVVDFDGVLTLEDNYPEIHALNGDMIEVLRRRPNNIRLTLSTCREGDLLLEALAACLYEGLTFDFVNENDPDRIDRFGGDCRKISGDLVIDDRAPNYWNDMRGQYEFDLDEALCIVENFISDHGQTLKEDHE